MGNFPKSFTYLEDIDSSILQDIVYATERNAMGRPLVGYEAPRCIIAKPLGEALSKAQKKAKKDGYVLKVFDAYRPVRAVEDILGWTKRGVMDTKLKKIYAPNVDITKLFELGFVKLRSAHCRGAAVDLTLTDSKSNKELDMGTCFDFFGEQSHTANKEVTKEAQENRKYLCKLMEEVGFHNYLKEWWHFTYNKELFPDTYFDFVVK